MRIRLSLVPLACAVAVLTSWQAPAATVQVKIRNLAPMNGTFLTPVWAGFHDGSFDLYDSGSPASSALERLAEDGSTAPLTALFAMSGAGTQQGTLLGPMGAIAPGETATMSFNLDPLSITSRYFSYASMVIPSNDAFIANGNPLAFTVFNAMGQFVGGSFTVSGSMVLDAGTELNDEVPANTAFFGQMAPDTGVTTNSVVMLHPGFIPGGPILSSAMFANADFTATGYNVAEITISEVPEPATIALIGTPLLLLALRRYRGRQL